MKTIRAEHFEASNFAMVINVQISIGILLHYPKNPKYSMKYRPTYEQICF